MHKLKSKYIKHTSNNRLYQLSKPIIGLTGGIATGKSTVSKMLVDKGVPLIDADELVKDIYKDKETKDFIKKLGPQCTKENEVNFRALRELFFSNPQIKSQVEGHIYSKLPLAFNKKLQELSFKDYDFLIYDVPLLFEKGIENLVDTNILVYASQKEQIQRIIKRDKNTVELAQKIIDSQMSIEDKRQLSDFIIENTDDFNNLEKNTEKILSELLD